VPIKKCKQKRRQTNEHVFTSIFRIVFPRKTNSGQSKKCKQNGNNRTHFYVDFPHHFSAETLFVKTLSTKIPREVILRGKMPQINAIEVSDFGFNLVLADRGPRRGLCLERSTKEEKKI
jgi:hypothetical protein